MCSDVTPRLPRMTSFNRGNETPNRIANADCEIPSGLRNSSSSISPGCVGGASVGRTLHQLAPGSRLGMLSGSP